MASLLILIQFNNNYLSFHIIEDYQAFHQDKPENDEVYLNACEHCQNLEDRARTMLSIKN